MSKLDRYEERVWDRFFDDMALAVQTMTREEVQAELKRRKIDVTSAISRVHRAVATARAKAHLAAAREKRPGIVEQLTNVVAPQVEGWRQRIGELISGRLQGSEQAAYFRKLNEAAGDDDLRALMDDIERLDALGGDDDAETES